MLGRKLTMASTSKRISDNATHITVSVRVSVQVSISVRVSVGILGGVGRSRFSSHLC